MSTVARFSPNGRFFAVATAKVVYVYLTETRELVVKFEGHLEPINDLAWSHDSRYIASAGDDFVAILWDLQNKQYLRSFRGHTEAVTSVRFALKGNLVVTGSIDENLRIWDAIGGNCLKILAVHTEPVSGVDISFDGSVIVSGSYDGLIRLWDVDTGLCLKTISREDNSPLRYVAFTPNAKYLVASTVDGAVTLWDYFKPRALRVFATHTVDTCTRSLLVYKDCLVIAVQEGIHIWNVETCDLVGAIEMEGVTSVDIKDGLLLAASASGVRLLSLSH